VRVVGPFIAAATAQEPFTAEDAEDAEPEGFSAVLGVLSGEERLAMPDVRRDWL